MPRYLALLIGAGDPQQKAAVPEDVSARFMQAWGEWHAAHANATVEAGSPLGANVRVWHDRAEDVANRLVAWMVVQAETREAAAAIFAEHPHVSLLSGNAVDVMELKAVPAH